MVDQTDQPSQALPDENEQAEVFAASQDKDGSWHFSRRDFLFLGLAAGGALLLKGVCPRYAANAASSQPARAGMLPGPYLYAEPQTGANIIATVQQNDIVLLESDQPGLGWVEVSTQSGQHGWLPRSFVDFSRAFTGGS